MSTSATWTGVPASGAALASLTAHTPGWSGRRASSGARRAATIGTVKSGRTIPPLFTNVRVVWLGLGCTSLESVAWSDDGAGVLGTRSRSQPVTLNRRADSYG